MSEKNWAIITVSREGVDRAEKVKAALDGSAEIYTMEKYQRADTRPVRGKIGAFFGKLMADYDTILCIMATGIVVRSIAPHLGHKSKDPGILVMDTAGRYVISLLSGHLGHANANAVKLAKRIGAEPVITTGTDVKGSVAVDVLAEKLGCVIADFTAAKNVTAEILDGKSVKIVDEAGCDFTGVVLPDNISQTAEDPAAVILISEEAEPEGCTVPWVQLVPKKYSVGIGCRKDTSGVRIIAAVAKIFAELRIHPLAIRHFATIGLKAGERGIHEACDHFYAELKVIPDDFVKMVQGRFEGSDFVYKTTGLYAVSEPCGCVASGFGDCILEKQKCGGITLSVWQPPLSATEEK